MLGLVKRIFVILLTSIVSVSNHARCVLLSNQPTLINLHPREYSQEFCYYPVVVNIDRCVGSCNTFDDLSLEYVFQMKQKFLNLHVFDMITGIHEKILTKQISCKCECKFDSKKCNSNQKWNASAESQKNIKCSKKVIFGILLH